MPQAQKQQKDQSGAGAFESLVKILALMDSSNDGESVAAFMAARKKLTQLGFEGFKDLLEKVATPPDELSAQERTLYESALAQNVALHKENSILRPTFSEREGLKAELKDAQAKLKDIQAALDQADQTCEKELGAQRREYEQHLQKLEKDWAAIQKQHDDEVEALHTREAELLDTVENLSAGLKGVFTKTHDKIADLAKSLAPKPRLAKSKTPALDFKLNTGKKTGKRSSLGAADDLEPGKLYKGEGIYLGRWEPRDQDGQSLNKIFNVFAAPEDLKKPDGLNLLMTFNEAVKHVAGLKNFHGHDGGNFENDAAILEAVRNNPEALAKWFIPTRELLHGKTRGGNKLQPANLYDSRNTGAFKDTLTKRSHFAYWYWSLTEHPNDPSHVYSIDFTCGVVSWGQKDNLALPSRVVRAVYVGPA